MILWEKQWSQNCLRVSQQRSAVAPCRSLVEICVRTNTLSQLSLGKQMFKDGRGCSESSSSAAVHEVLNQTLNHPVRRHTQLKPTEEPQRYKVNMFCKRITPPAVFCSEGEWFIVWGVYYFVWMFCCDIVFYFKYPAAAESHFTP